MDWTKWIADLLAAGIGAFVASLIAYRTSYWTEKGKNLATYEDIKTLLAEERGKAYEQEKGKRLATHEDIENVLKEVQAVTRETETIKAQIGSDLWTRQRAWEQRRESYFKILRCSHALHDKLNLLSSTLVAVNANGAEMSPEQIMRWHEQENEVMGEIGEAQKDLFNSVVEAGLFLDPTASSILDEAMELPVPFLSGGSGYEYYDRQKINLYMDQLSSWIGTMIEFGRRDLHGESA